MTVHGVKRTLRKHLEYQAAKLSSRIPGHAFIRDCALRALKVRTQAFSKSELAASALVIAPHPDDETLGCGGMIALKRRHGADVSVVVLTDGGQSHRPIGQTPLLENLARQRAGECESALGHLGVSGSALVQLGLPDGQLASHTSAGAHAMLALIDRMKPAQVFVPHCDEPPSDHRAAHLLTLSALAQSNQRPAVFAYPVWMWQQWPWVAVDAERDLGHEIFVASWRARFGWQWLSQFDRAAITDAVLEQKRQALAAYGSQMHRPSEDSSWSTLADVSHGQFLRCFFEGIEPFQTLSVHR